MSLFNSVHSYGAIAKLFHWLMAVAIFVMLAVGLYMEDMDDSPDKFWLYGIHKAVGAILLAMVVFRLIWKYANPSPELPDSLNKLQKMAAGASHWVLYILMFAMPLSGWAMSSAAGYPVSVFGWFTLPSIVQPDKEIAHLFNEVHETIGSLMIAIIIIHVMAALFHHFYYRDNVLKRMLPSRKR